LPSANPASKSASSRDAAAEAAMRSDRLLAEAAEHSTTPTATGLFAAVHASFSTGRRVQPKARSDASKESFGRSSIESLKTNP
jgi:hypothetical protein